MVLLPAVTQEARCPLHPAAALTPALSGDDWFWGIGGTFHYGACPTCGTWVLSPRPVPAEMGPFYAGYYSDEELARWRRNVAKRGERVALRSAVHARDLRTQAQLAGCPIPANPKVLDVGAGLGMFLVAAKNVWGATVRGLDTSAKCRAFVEDVWKLPMDAGELADQEYPDGSFDLVATRHCLEHVYNPASELKEIHRVLKPSGLLEVEVPMPGVLARIFRGSWPYLQPPTHLWHFPVPALHQLLQENGFDVVATRPVWAIGELTGGVLMALGFRGVAPRLVFPARRNLALLLALAPLFVVDILLARVLCALGQSGIVRVLAKRRG